MPANFRPLSKRVRAETNVRRDQIMDPVFVAEANESLEHYGVLVFHRYPTSEGVHTHRSPALENGWSNGILQYLRGVR